jgi:cytochrome c oxidase cbb3-type subunit 2
VNPAPLLFLASFFALAVSWLGFVLAPQLQLGRQSEVTVETTGQIYPSMRSGLARQGEAVYRANGCFYCHSQQVRPRGFGSDVARGWGGRPGEVQSVDQDYLYDRPVMLGSQRVGPDLANIGLRQANSMAGLHTTNEVILRQASERMLLAHLYNPQATMPGSMMPPFRFLFEQRKLQVGEKPSPDALPAMAGVPAGYEVVPTDDARALAAYLLSLRSDAVLFEAPPYPLPPSRTNAPAASTNAPPKVGAATTNEPPAK